MRELPLTSIREEVAGALVEVRVYKEVGSLRELRDSCQREMKRVFINPSISGFPFSSDMCVRIQGRGLFMNSIHFEWRKSFSEFLGEPGYLRG
jgi:hypothetical protein